MNPHSVPAQVAGSSVEPRACPSCGSEALMALGAIPGSSRFAGKVLPYVIPGGNLLRCESCALWFRHPRLPAEVLGALYAQGSSQAWAGAVAARPDWTLIRAYLRYLKPHGKVLDVGCFDGALLASLGGDYQRYGVEMNAQAAQRARARGVTVLAGDFDLLDHRGQQFDALIATDVIEHMRDPRRFLDACSQLLAPGGVMLISTGSTDAWNWRLMGGQYWYCANAEHLCFLNEAWVRGASAQLGLEPLAIERFAHDTSRALAMTQAALNLVYRLTPGLLAAARRWLARDAATRTRADLRRSPPSWSTARDHMLFVLQASV